MVNKKELILHKTKHRKGKQHDYDIFKKNRPPPIPTKVELGVDLSYLDNQKRLP
jgi:hypothetical protein